MGWPIGFSGFGISLIRSSGFGIWKQIRNWKYGREARSRVIGSCGRWNTKNNPRDNGIVQNCVGIAELKPQSNLSKTHRYCCRALVHFLFLAFSSIFPLNWIAKQSFFFFFFFLKTSFQHAKSRLKIFARCRPLTALTFLAYVKIGGMFKSNAWQFRSLSIVWNSSKETAQTQGNPSKNENALNE